MTLCIENKKVSPFLKIVITRAALFFLSLFIAPLSAGPAADRLNDFFAKKGAMRADFVQTVQGAAFVQPEESRGTLLMQRPGKFRWDYRLPYEQQIIADGKQLWIYDVDLEQVIVKPLDKALGDTPALLLSGDGGVTQRFDIKELPDRDDGLLWVQLLPKQADTGFTTVKLGFDQQYLRSMELVDGFEQVTKLIFNNVETGITLPVGTFVFVPPKGVDVIGGKEEGR
ncbi:MAG: outer membrane lipoprotein chaperone LolA [Gammaproteobacteria bacterium]|nr:outer membrane lipoprotein chaperone LolA [Gammaproteobacteria bacterium]